MKKRFLLLIPLIAGLAACNDSSTINNQEDVDNLKTLLAAQDLSPFNEKSFGAVYSQNFSVYSNMINDEGRYIDFFNYQGSYCTTSYYYNVEKETYEELIKEGDTDIFDLMCAGSGYYHLSQTATIKSFLEDQFEDRDANERVSFLQELVAHFDDENKNLQIDNQYMFADYYNEDNFVIRMFSGIIDTNILFDYYSTKTLTDIFSRINVYDGPGYCQNIDSLYYQVCFDLLDSSDKEISDFIINNNIGYSEGEEYLELSFELKEQKYIDFLTENDIFPGTLKGTLYFDKETKAFDNFDYKIIYLEEEIDYSTNYVHTASMEFKASGYSRHGKPEGYPEMSDEPTEFTDPDEFINQVAEQALPNIA